MTGYTNRRQHKRARNVGGKGLGENVARRIAISITESLLLLTQFPERGRPGRKSGTRELVLSNSPYLAIYRVKSAAVEILRILHGAQKWP